VLCQPAAHQERGIAFDQREPAQRAVALADRVDIDPLQVEALVLERVGELVGEGHLLGGPDGARLGDDHHLARLGVVVARDLRPEEVDIEIAQRGIGGQEAEGLERVLGHRDLVGRVLLLELGLDAGLHLVL
jgi:hypothetical protein